MKNYKDGHFTGERALFNIHDAKIDNCLFDDGESPLKEGSNLNVINTTFGWKYPLWYGKNHKVADCKFLDTARAGVWYTFDSTFNNCDFVAPKLFRRCKNITIKDAKFSDALETMWFCEDIKLENIKIQGNYFALHSNNIEADNIVLNGDYGFDSCENVKISNSILNTKDAFWNCKNVTISNCTIKGEYFSWNSENITLIDSTIISHQGFCYMKNIKLINCKVIDTDLAFEYCEDIDADIKSSFASIKNPINGRIVVDKVDEVIFDDPKIDKNKTEIIFRS